MLLVFANRHDPGAHSLVARWASYGATLMTCEDLSVPGWRHTLDPSAESRATIGGRTVPQREITAVLIRWPCVFAQELGHIAPEDRVYVAAEMTAFLRSWLTQLRCPVLNLPSASSLLGPAWRPEQWIYRAARLGIPVCPIRRHAKLSDTSSSVQAKSEHVTVTVIGERCFGDVHPDLAGHALRLAATAGVALLDVYFTSPDAGAELISADLLANLEGDERANAVLGLMLHSGERP